MKLPKLTPKLKRIFVIVLASLGVLTLVLLAASLQSVELKPAQAFFSGEGSQTNVFSEFAHLAETVGTISLGEAIMLTVGFLILFVLLLAMLSPEARKRLLKMIFRVGLTVWAIYYALTKFRPEGVFGTEVEGAALEQGPEVIGVSPPPYVPLTVPPWLIYVASLLTVLFFVGIGFWLYRILRPPKRQFQDLARAARSALKDLSDGRDWEDAVIRCYVRMSEALGQERGLHRQQAMTPQEFASRLEQAGLPSDPIRRLTRLFEKARYGGQKSSREDVNEAVTCLTAILQAVGAQA
jgi:hypothetical protein